MLVHKFRYEAYTEFAAFTYGEDYPLVSSHLVPSFGIPDRTQTCDLLLMVEGSRFELQSL